MIISPDNNMITAVQITYTIWIIGIKANQNV